MEGPGGILSEYQSDTTAQQHTTYLMAGGGLVGMRVARTEWGGGPTSIYTRYFHKDHLGSIAVISNEAGAVVERLSYDAWGKRRQPNGEDDPAGAITSQTTRGFTEHEQLDTVGLVHMNGRVYDPLLARFTSADPMTENPFSTQGWNRYAYVGNSPVNFTDPSGYCFMGCFWKPIFKAIGKFFRENWGSLVQIAAGALCSPIGLGPVCAVAASTIVTGIMSGDLGLALRAGFITAVTAGAFHLAGDLTGSLGLNGVLNPKLGGHGPLEFLSEAHLFNISSHALVGCGSAVASGGECGPGALSGAAGSFATPLAANAGSVGGLVVTSTAGGLASVAGGGKFANGAVTAAFGYLFNRAAECALDRSCPDKIFGPGRGGGAINLGVGAAGASIGAWLGTQINAIIDVLTGAEVLNISPPHDAHDPNGPKAPGKPGEAERFKDPKGGEDWVKNPNGSGWGWAGGNGDVWVPTGQGGKAHGGPHWDVQTPGGRHRNVYPGGRTR